MLVLFDQATPVPLRPYLKGHNVRTAFEEGWERLRNGDLLAAAEQAGFDVFVTTDKNMQYQQKLTGRKIAVILVTKQQWPKLRLHAEQVAKTVDAAAQGSYIEVP
jgi:hypothetical protein